MRHRATRQPATGTRFPVKYYMTAMLFIVFDIEIIFLYPWAVAFDKLGCSAWWRWSRSSPRCSSRTPTCGGAAVWNGTSHGNGRKLPSGILLTSVEKMAGYARKRSVLAGHVRPGLLRHRADGDRRARHDLARFGMERASNTPRQADLMIVAGRVSQKMAPVLRQIYDQMSEPKWVISMGVCASSGGMFNNYAIVQGVDHIVPVDIYLPGCPPRPEMLLDAIVKLHDKIQNMKLGREPGARDHRA